MSNNNSTFSLNIVHPDEVEKIIRGLKDSTSSGLDYISTSIIKKMVLEFLPEITHIVNLSIVTGSSLLHGRKLKLFPCLKVAIKWTRKIIGLLQCVV